MTDESVLNFMVDPLRVKKALLGQLVSWGQVVAVSWPPQVAVPAAQI